MSTTSDVFEMMHRVPQTFPEPLVEGIRSTVELGEKIWAKLYFGIAFPPMEAWAAEGRTKTITAAISKLQQTFMA
jgi:hypothetical protein